MSKPRYDWWSYAKGMVRRYPALKLEHESLRGQNMTASYSGMPSSHGGMSRPVEMAASKGLTGVALKEYQAVATALEKVGRYDNGRDRLRVIALVYWEKTHTLEGAAMAVSCSDATVKRWHGQFIRLVAKQYGLLD